MEFRILGPVEVWREGRPIVLSGGQTTLLTRLLLDANRVVSVDRLLDQLWPVPPESGVKALQMRVSDLRQAFDEAGVDGALILTRGEGYVIELGGNEFDLRRFESLVAEGEQALSGGDVDVAGDVLHEALGLWRGPPLTGAGDAPFVAAARARLDELRLAALEKRLAADLALGRHSDVVGELEELTAEHPFFEGFHAQLMLALYRAGRQAHALVAYQRARTRLVDELGIEPSRTLQELEQEILRQDPALDWEAPAPQAQPAPPALADTPERSILVVPHDRSKLDRLIAIAEPLTRRPPREIILAALVEGSGELEAVSDELEDWQKQLLGRGVPARSAAFTSATPGSDLSRLSTKQDVDLLLTDAPLEFLDDGVPPIELRAILEEAPCDVATLVSTEAVGRGNKGDVVVPFGGGYHEWSALEIGAWLALARGSALRLIGTEAQPEEGKRDASGMLADVSLIVQRAAGLVPKPQLVQRGQNAIVEASRDAGLLIVGLSDRWAEEGLGTARLELARGAYPPILVVRRGVRPSGMAPLDRLTRYTWSLAEAPD